MWIRGYGSIHLTLRSEQGLRVIRLDNVAYCPDLLCNLVSFRMLKCMGLWWDTEKGITKLRCKDRTIVADI